MKQKFRFIFRFDGELGQTLHDCRPGDADRVAAQLARKVGEIEIGRASCRERV